MSPVAPVRIFLMGEFRVEIDGREIGERAWPGRRSGELVQLLALSDRHRLARDQVIEALWPHLDPAAGAANLRKAAHHARRALQVADAVVLDRVSAALFPSRRVVVDAHDFEHRAAAALVTEDPAQAAAVAGSYAGDLLPGARYEEWAQAPRAHLQRRLVDLLRHGRQWARLVDVDPTDEPAYVALMREALASGNRHAAIRWYGRLRSSLARELGVTPDAEATELYEACIAGFAVAEPAFIGRQVELALGAATLDAAANGETGALVLRGPAGIGKSTLARRVGRRACDEGWQVASVTVAEAGGPYAPLGRLVEQLVARNPDVLRTLPHRTHAVLDTVADVTTPDEHPSGAMTRHLVVGALRRLCDGLDGPGVIVVVDDAHHADEATRDVLLRLVGDGTAGFLAVFAYRPELAGRAFTREIARLQRARRVVEIDVGPLAGDETEALAVAASAVRPRAGDLARIVAAAEGNPLFAIELARSVDATGHLRVAPSAWEAISTRFLDLDEATIALLQRLAVAGDDLDAASVVALTGLAEAEAFDLLDTAIAAGVLVVSAAGYRFRHELVRQALVEPVPQHRRIAIHRDAARRLVERGADPSLIAHHWLQGGRPGDAAEWLLAAARRAMELGAFTDARAYAERVLVDAPEHADALCLYAEALDAVGDPRAAATYAAAARVAGAPRSDEIRPKQALALLKAGDPRAALEALEGVAPQTTRARLSQAITLSGAAAIGFADPDFAAVKASEARRYALEAGDPGALVDASWAESLAAHARGDLTGRLSADLLATRDLPEIAIRVFDGHLCATERLLYGARPYAEVIEFATHLAAEAERVGAARGRAFALTLRGEANLLSGRLADADDDLTAGTRLHHAIGAGAGESLSLQRRAQLASYEDRRADATTILADALAAARESNLGHHLLDRIYGTRIALGADGAGGDGALALIDETEIAVRGPAETCPACRITLTVPAAIAAARAGDVERAASYADISEMLATVMLRQPGWSAAVTEVRAHCALAEGDLATARARFTEAGDAFRSAGQPLDAARCAAWSARPR